MNGKTILISGGTGALGQAIAQQLLGYNPRTVRLLTNVEYELYKAQQQLKDTRFRFLLGDIREKERVARAMTGVDIVIHSAALKHVPICEYNPIEAISTNILGSINVINAALDNKVDKVLAISTDKAVHPINIYGATKLAMEKLFIHSNVYGQTKFSCVRFGNFWASPGSLIPLIDEQVKKGEEITLTHKEMTRLWISLENAAKFVIDCLCRMNGGEVFIPKMTEKSIKEIITTLYPGKPYKVIGKREGEKLHELLFAEGEEPEEHGDYFVIRGNYDKEGI